MAARGVLFAIDEATARRLTAATGDDDAVMEVIEEIEEDWDEENLAETDKAWDAIHRALTDGTLSWGSAMYPLDLPTATRWRFPQAATDIHSPT